MRIYYFGELIEENGRKIKNETKTPKQIKLNFESLQRAAEAEEKQDAGMQSIGDILQELDMTLDSFRSNGFGRRSHA